LSGVAAILAGGVLTHAVLMGSLLAFLHGWIGAMPLAAIQILNMGAPIAIALLAGSVGGARQGSAEFPQAR
ncbi:hypothetical protein, partial [Bordetella flabilis]|uniref:hypothetical protein n=1 Tax=Bordetella flabilis TaxID=463014 RepID=UPI0039EEC577